MREILFRGKAVKSDAWHYGMFCAEGYDADFPCIIPSDSDRMHIASGDWHVDLETIGQFTGLLDKNGTKIFEGDIVRIDDQLVLSAYNGRLFEVEFDECAFWACPNGKRDIAVSLFNKCAEYEVVGNIHDNPELLKGGAE